MRYLVRNRNGDELVVPSLRDLHRLYLHGFVSDDDLVRAASSDRWVRVGAFPALQGVREEKADWKKVGLLLLAAVLLAAGIAILLRG